MQKPLTKEEYEKKVRLIIDVDKSGIDLEDHFSGARTKLEILKKNGCNRLITGPDSHLRLDEIDLDSLTDKEGVRISLALLHNYRGALNRVRSYEAQERTARLIRDFLDAKSRYEGIFDVDEETGEVELPAKYNKRIPIKAIIGY